MIGIVLLIGQLPLLGKPLNVERRAYIPQGKDSVQKWQNQRYSKNCLSKKQNQKFSPNKAKTHRTFPTISSQDAVVPVTLDKINKYQFRSDRGIDQEAPRYRAGGS